MNRLSKHRRTPQIPLQNPGIGRNWWLITEGESWFRFSRINVTRGLLFHNTQPLRIAFQEWFTIPVIVQPTLNHFIRGAHIGLADGKFPKVRFQIDQKKNNERQAQHRQKHGPKTIG